MRSIGGFLLVALLLGGCYMPLEQHPGKYRWTHPQTTDRERFREDTLACAAREAEGQGFFRKWFLIAAAPIFPWDAAYESIKIDHHNRTFRCLEEKGYVFIEE